MTLPVWFPSDELLVALAVLLVVVLFVNRDLRWIMTRVEGERSALLIAGGVFLILVASSIPIASVPMEIWGVLGVSAVVVGVIRISNVDLF